MKKTWITTTASFVVLAVIFVIATPMAVPGQGLY